MKTPDGEEGRADAGEEVGEGVSRRRFFSLFAIVGAGLVVPTLIEGCSVPVSTSGDGTLGGPLSLPPTTAHAPGLAPAAATFRHSPPLERFVQPLRGVFPIDKQGIPVAVPDGTRSYLGGRMVVDHYTLDIKQYRDTLHPALGPTTLWGYHSVKNLGGSVPQRHLGGIIIAEKGKPIQITFRNTLPPDHILPVDPTIVGADGAQNRTCVHLHGGLVPWTSDGGPMAWFSPDNGDGKPVYGPSADDGKIYRLLAGPKPKAGEAEFYYPIDQSARFLWYHDHAVGITRLNAYAGVASAIIIRDDFERSLVATEGLPAFIENGGREVPLVFQDKVFVDKDLRPAGPDSPDHYPGSARTQGSLWYPFRYDTARWSSPPDKKPDGLAISAIPEMFGDTILTNGVAYPRAAVEPRRYRLRILNATQARFLNLQLYVEDSAGRPDFTRPGPDFLVIGTEGGFLFQPAVVPSGRRLHITTAADGSRSTDPSNGGGSLLTAPGERWDVVVDLSGFAGKKLIMYSDAPGPFPGGAPENDGEIDRDGVLLNQMVMRLDVAGAASGPADPPLGLSPARPLGADPGSGVAAPPAGIRPMTTTAPVDIPAGVKVRDLTLNEVFDDRGRLIQMVGTNKLRKLPAGFTLPVDPEHGLPLGGRLLDSGPMNPAMQYEDDATETPGVGDIEVWRIANLTSDVHPMHFHLVNVLLLSRQPFNGYEYDQHGLGQATELGVRRGPEATELGWKDTVKMNPSETTIVIMKFDLAPVPFAVPPSTRTGGNEFVWHCHILEHEEHDMMRPLVVQGSHPQLR